MAIALGACGSEDPPQIRATPLNAASDASEGSPEGASDDVASDSSTTVVAYTDDAEETADAGTMIVDTAPPADLAQLMQLRPEDFPASYDFSTEVNTDDVCDGYANPTVEFVPLAETATEFVGDHVHTVGIAVYESPEAAAEAFDYVEEVLLACSGVLVEAEDGTSSIAEHAPIEVEAFEGVDRINGVVSFVSAAELSIEFGLYQGVIDSVLFSTMSTDPTIIDAMTDRVLARYRGEEETGELAPEGSMVTYAGFSDPEYFSWPEGPAVIRTLEFPAAGANEWAEVSTDERIDTVASSACAVTSVLQVGDDVDAVITSVFTAEELSQYSAQAMGEVFGASLNTYCPGLMATLEAAVTG